MTLTQTLEQTNTSKQALSQTEIWQRKVDSQEEQPLYATNV